MVFYWELENFQLVGSSSPETNAIRKVLFHSEGDALFTGSQDSLRVSGSSWLLPSSLSHIASILQVQNWEPATHLDFLPVPWGKVADLQESGQQLVSVLACSASVT